LTTDRPFVFRAVKRKRANQQKSIMGDFIRSRLLFL
jgi:hypothetical protein